MEDILASIKRIIAEDSEVPARGARLKPRPVEADHAPLVEEPIAEEEAPELADAAPDIVRDEQPAPAPELRPAIATDEAAPSADVLELTSPIAAEPAPPPPAAEQADAAAPAQLEDLVPAAEHAPELAATRAAADPVAAPALAGDAPAETAGPDQATILSGAAAAASRHAFAALSQLQIRPEAGPGLTLEALVADLLRPMLRDWLDRELPGIVERLVAAEIARVSGRG
ncbi:DUF2497 domain-containing protein [Sphingomonas morindae]|uniref:DUF2497 domain-containing protein n=1 Tax=Sphingomonas morindae TaxID=1541170 RepID=A0ABY4X736_9SPHN|nr:DUF2497 domain-containing protein [Sphingomonas morindae]USI72686.1 DUF2497 domain-containing protein [Sphingomonas morindae]